MNNASGVLNVNKPAGWSSAQVVAYIKGILKVRKVGHCGTLDPRATGVLLVCFGQATKMSSNLMSARKTYRGIFRLGVKTDTGDLDGKKISESDPGEISLEDITAVSNGFSGKIMQVPPMYSAIKIKGRKLYELAREGRIIDRPAREVDIYSFKILKFEYPDVHFSVSCSKGTYIRSLVEDVGDRLSCGAVLVSLERSASGEFTVEDAIPWEELTRMNQERLLMYAVPLKIN
ncbi:MAG: tRNA pseudouridine(55) synthase TruB [bacterium]